MNDPKKKRNPKMQTIVATAEELKEAQEIIVVIEEMLLDKYPQGVQFEHLLSWWAAIGPIEA